MRKGFVTLPLILLIIGLLIGGAAVFGYFQLKPKSSTENQTTSAQKVSNQNSTTSPSPQTTDETSSWKSYSGKFGNLKYPQSWHTRELAQPDILLVQEKETGSTGIAFGIGNDWKSSYEGALKYEINKEVNQVGETGKYTLNRLANISVDGNTAIVIELNPESIGVNTPVKEVYLSRNGIYYKMWVSGDTQAEFETNKKIFDKVLSTFKFY